MELDLLTEITSKRPAGKLITASALLIACPWVFKRMLVVKILPTVKLPEDGLKESVAASALGAKEKIKKQRKISAYFLFLSEIIFLSFFKNESKSNKKK